MIMFAIVTIGIGLTVFGHLCATAPIWDEDRQMPAEDVSAAAERA